MKRRDFLKGAVAAATIAPVVASLPAPVQARAIEPVRSGSGCYMIWNAKGIVVYDEHDIPRVSFGIF